jgi:hypothetical protein
MRTLAPQRKRVVLYYFLTLLFMAASFVERHMKAHMGVTLPTDLGTIVFMLAGLHGLYNLTDEPYR